MDDDLEIKISYAISSSKSLVDLLLFPSVTL